MANSDEYPSARAALLDSDKLVNFRCFLKYILWHGAYTVLALFGVLMVAGAKVLDYFKRSSNGAAVSTVNSGLQHPAVKVGSRWIFGGLMTLYAAGLIAYSLYLFVQILLSGQVAALLTVGAAIVLIAVIMVAIAYGVPVLKRVLRRIGSAAASGASKAGSVAQETPGLRRVYGECPVSLDIEPKWFDELFGDEP